MERVAINHTLDCGKVSEGFFLAIRHFCKRIFSIFFVRLHNLITNFHALWQALFDLTKKIKSTINVSFFTVFELN